LTKIRKISRLNIKKLFLIFFLLSCSNSELDNFFKENNVHLSLGDSFLVKTKSLRPLIVLTENSKQNELLKINIKAVKNYEQAFLEAKKTIILIVSQYEFTMAPYPGQITVATNCGTALHPRLIDRGNLNVITAFANVRLALSICEGDDYQYKVATSFFVNSENNQLLIVDYYYNKLSNEAVSLKFFKDNFKNYKNINLADFKDLIR
jgi:hypothetical protein